MGYLTWMVSPMSIAARLIIIRREHSLTQQEMANKINMHVNQVRRYESGSAQPSLEALKKISVAMSVTIDSLVFEDAERGPDEELMLQFEALTQFTEDEKRVAKELLESLILKHNAKRAFAGQIKQAGN